jgi:hypothetical protein
MSHRRLRTVLSSRIARFLGCLTLAVVAFVASPSSGRLPVTRFDALPRNGERLPQALWLPHCKMRIVEWRPTGALRTETSPSEQSLAVLDETCRSAFERYGSFLRAKRLPRLHTEPDVLPTISLLPGNTLLDGKSSRALNDLPTRFDAVAPGCCYWGLYVDSLNHLFLRNDPLIKDDGGNLVENPRFVRTLTHEIGHVLSSRLGVWDVVGYDRQRDEDLAEEFVAFMGMRFPAESSAEDLAYHHRTFPQSPPPAEGTTTATISGARHAKPLESPLPSASANTSPQR